MLVFISRSGAPTPRNRREAASRCRCTAERSTRREGIGQGGSTYKNKKGGNSTSASHIGKQSRSSTQKIKKKFAPTGNRTRVCTVAGYYSTTRPSVLFCSFSLSEESHESFTRSAILGLIIRPKNLRPAKNVNVFHSCVSTEVLPPRLTPRLTPRHGAAAGAVASRRG